MPSLILGNAAIPLTSDTVLINDPPQRLINYMATLQGPSGQQEMQRIVQQQQGGGGGGLPFAANDNKATDNAESFRSIDVTVLSLYYNLWIIVITGPGQLGPFTPHLINLYSINDIGTIYYGFAWPAIVIPPWPVPQFPLRSFLVSQSWAMIP